MELSNKIKIIFSDILKVKKYILIYGLFLILFLISFFDGNNYLHPKSEIIALIIIFISGIIAIYYSFKRKTEIHKIAFVIILIFGILTVFLNPTLIACDENEHFARSEMTSSGVIIPKYIEGKGYVVSNIFYQLDGNRGKTFLEGSFSSEKIADGSNYYSSGFPQNPFYGYIMQAIGILLAKILDLSIIWTMWLGRLFNLLLYGSIVSIAIKKAPVYKIPLLVVSCIPIAIYQSASFSIDPFINGFAILAIGYFIYMYKTDSKIQNKDILVFFTSILLISLIKMPYMLLTLLILLIPKEKFKSKKLFIFSRILPIAIILISMIYSYFYASQQLENTYRGVYFRENNVSVSGQIGFMLNNPLKGILPFLQLGNMIPIMINDLFIFSHMFWIYASRILSFLYIIFFLMLSFFYPNKMNLTKNNRFKIAIIVFLIVIGTFFIQYLSWTPIGANNIEGVFTRYFIPLFALIPMIVGVFKVKTIKNLDLAIITIVIIFLAGVLLLTLSRFY